jgi:predicted nucleic acid-binding protein
LLELEAVIVADSGPLIGLGKIGRLELLRKLARSVVIPAPVWREVVEAGGGRVEAEEVRRLFSADVVEPDAPLFDAYRLFLGAGEASALALAAGRPDALLLMDDARARRIAAAQGFRCLGSIGLLLRAKRHGYLVAIGPEIRALRKCGIFLSDEIVARVLRAAEEDGRTP